MHSGRAVLSILQCGGLLLRNSLSLCSGSVLGSRLGLGADVQCLLSPAEHRSRPLAGVLALPGQLSDTGVDFW